MDILRPRSHLTVATCTQSPAHRATCFCSELKNRIAPCFRKYFHRLPPALRTAFRPPLFGWRIPVLCDPKTPDSPPVSAYPPRIALIGCPFCLHVLHYL